MQTATLVLSPTSFETKLDRAAQARAVFKAAFSQARRQLRPTPRYGLGSSYGWTLDALRNRFGAGAWPITQKAVAIAFDAATVARAATGTPAELARQGMLTRCVRLEAAPRGGWSWAWTHDPLAAVNLNRSYRLHLARERRAVARAMAEDRRALERGPLGSDRYALTVLGVLALREAETARATAG